MSFAVALRTMLPTKDGINSHITNGNGYDPTGKNGRKHGGVDLNYIGGQTSPVNRSFPPIYSPIAGTISLPAPNKWNIIKVVDANGFSHEFLHCNTVLVTNGQAVQPGAVLGRMGRAGCKDIHLHYQLRKQVGAAGTLNPVEWWNNNGTTTAPPDVSEAAHEGDPQYHHAEPESTQSIGNIEEFKPRQPGVSTVSNIALALWTNRVPDHEPWPRTLMCDTPDLNALSDEPEANVNHNPQLTDTSEEGSKNIGRIEGEETIERGPFWRR